MPEPRRFLPPWCVKGVDTAFVVKDNGGQKLAYVYYEEEPSRRSAGELPSRNQARHGQGIRKR